MPFNATDTFKNKSAWQKRASIVQTLFGARARKNLSLFLLLATTATLYYATIPSDIAPNLSAHRGAISRHTGVGGKAGGLDKQDPAWLLWKTLNPTESIIHLRIESPTIMTLLPDVDDANNLPKPHRPRFRSIRSLLWLVRIMVLPIAATIIALYGLLLYLLKDTELLEAQKHRARVEEEAAQTEVPALRSQASFSTLPRAFSSDVELIASSKNGQVVITVGLRNEIVIWQLDIQTHVSIDATDVLLRSASTSSSPSTVTCVAMDDSGEHCAVGAGAGIIAVWSIKHDRVFAFPHLFLDTSSAGVSELQFLPSKKGTKTPPQSRPTSPMEPVSPVSLVSVYESGVVAKWSVAQLPTAVQLHPSGHASIVKPHLLRVSPQNTLLVAFFLDDGKLDLQEVSETERILLPDFSVQAGNPTDHVTAVHVCRTLMYDETRTVVGVTTEAGVISLWDGLTGELIRTLDDAYGKVTQLSLSPVPLGTCRLCGHLRPDCFSLAFSANQIVHFFKVYHNDADTSRRCSCVPLQTTRRYDSLGKTSRSGSFAASNSPLSRHARLSSGMETAFPVSGHGVHSRRASEKDSSRRASTSDTLLLPLDEFEADHVVGPADGLRSSSKVASFWFSVHVVKVLDTMCERGGWGMHEGKIVGVRRRPRSQNKKIARDTVTSPGIGLSPSTLDRWELWTFDISDPDIQA